MRQILTAEIPFVSTTDGYGRQTYDHTKMHDKATNSPKGGKNFGRPSARDRWMAAIDDDVSSPETNKHDVVLRHRHEGHL